jgi:hypothetical protein
MLQVTIHYSQHGTRLSSRFCPREKECEMTIARSLYPVTVFLCGLGVGVIWSPIERVHTQDRRVLSVEQSEENREFLTQMMEIGGDEMVEFAEQFEGMTIRTNEYPLVVGASPDGRFVIRPFGCGETIASDLYYPDSAGIANDLNRHYSFSSAGRTYTLDIGRSIDDAIPERVLFSFAGDDGRELVYIDRGADGQWDSLIDRDGNSEQLFRREGLCWKERRGNLQGENNRSGESRRAASDEGGGEENERP